MWIPRLIGLVLFVFGVINVFRPAKTVKYLWDIGFYRPLWFSKEDIAPIQTLMHAIVGLGAVVISILVFRATL